MLSRASYLLIALMIALIFLTSWYAASLSRIIPFLGLSLVNVGTLQKGEIMETNAAGKMIYQGSVDQATEEGSGAIQFLGLRIASFQGATQAPWVLTARSGTANESTPLIHLEGDVQLNQASQGGRPAFQVVTDALDLNRETQVAQGTGRITFSEPGTTNQTTGVGFVGNLVTQTVELRSEVQGQYGLSH